MPMCFGFFLEEKGNQIFGNSDFVWWGPESVMWKLGNSTQCTSSCSKSTIEALGQGS